MQQYSVYIYVCHFLFLSNKEVKSQTEIVKTAKPGKVTLKTVKKKKKVCENVSYAL